MSEEEPGTPTPPAARHSDLAGSGACAHPEEASAPRPGLRSGAVPNHAERISISSESERTSPEAGSDESPWAPYAGRSGADASTRCRTAGGGGAAGGGGGDSAARPASVGSDVSAQSEPSSSWFGGSQDGDRLDGGDDLPTGGDDSDDDVPFTHTLFSGNSDLFPDGVGAETDIDSGGEASADETGGGEEARPAGGGMEDADAAGVARGGDGEEESGVDLSGVPFRNLDTGEIISLAQALELSTTFAQLPRDRNRPAADAAGEEEEAGWETVVGYLWKRGTTLNHPLRRWYVLSPSGLCYYASAQESVRSPHSCRHLSLPPGTQVSRLPAARHGAITGRPAFGLVLTLPHASKRGTATQARGGGGGGGDSGEGGGGFRRTDGGGAAGRAGDTAGGGGAAEPSGGGISVRELYAEHPDEQSLWYDALTRWLASEFTSSRHPSRYSFLSSRRLRSRLPASHPAGISPAGTSPAGSPPAGTSPSGLVSSLRHRQSDGAVTDTLGFPLSPTQARSWAEWAHIVSAAERVQLQLWATHLAHHGFPRAPDSKPDKKGRVWRERGAAGKGAESACKKLVRGGIPNSIRYRLWLSMSGALELWEAAPHMYSQLLDRAYRGGEIASEISEIDKDLHRTFPGHAAFGEGCEGRARLRDVLAAYALRNQTVGYCQALNYVAAMLLVALQLEAEACFWMLAVFCERLFPDFYCRDMTGIRIEQSLFTAFVKEITPQVHTHFSSLGVPVEMVSTQWFLCLFVDVLPAATVLRVWDVMLWEGPQVLMRTGAALLHVYRDSVLAARDFNSTSTLLQTIGSDLWHADRLILAMYTKNYVTRRPQQKHALKHLRKERQQQYLEVETSEVARLAQATHFTPADLDDLRAIIRTTARQDLALGRDAIDAAITEPLVLLLFERGAHVLNAPPRLGVDPIGRLRPKIDARAAFDVIHAKCCRRPEDAIDLGRLLTGLSALCRPDSADEALAYTLGAFDVDRDGGLSLQELAGVLSIAHGRCAAGEGPTLEPPADWEGYAARLVEAVAGNGFVGGEFGVAGGSGAIVRQPGFKVLMASEPALRRWLPVVGGGALSEEEAEAAARVRAVASAEAALAVSAQSSCGCIGGSGRGSAR